MGTIYVNMFKAVREDWKKLDRFIYESEGFSVPGLENGLLDNFQTFNQQLEAIRSNYINSNTGKYEGPSYYESPVAFVKHFTLEYNKTHRLHPLEIIDQVHYKNVKGNLAINQAFIAQIARFQPRFLLDQGYKIPEEYPTCGQFFYLKKLDVLKGLIKSNFRVNTTRTSQKELQYIRENYPSWINDSGDMILAKYQEVDEDGIVVSSQNITSKRDLIRLGQSTGKTDPNAIIDDLASEFGGKIELNPILEQYNYLDYLFTQEFMCATVGSFIAHPEKSKSSNVLEQEAAHFQAQHKRNVSFTAAMHAFQFNLLNGIPEQYNLAVIDDIADEQGTILGLNNGIKPFDGATFVNPFIVLLENNSLGGAYAGSGHRRGNCGFYPLGRGYYEYRRGVLFT